MMTDLKSLDAAVAEVEMFDAGRLRRGEVCSSKDRRAEVIAVDVELQSERRQSAGHGAQTAP